MLNTLTDEDFRFPEPERFGLGTLFELSSTETSSVTGTAEEDLSSTFLLFGRRFVLTGEACLALLAVGLLASVFDGAELLGSSTVGSFATSF